MFEPMRKGVDRGLYDGNHALLRKGGAAEIVRLAYSEHAADPTVGKVDLRKAAAELDELVDRLEGR